MKRAAILLALFLAFPSTVEAKRLYDNDGRTIETAQARPDRVRVQRADRSIRQGAVGRTGVRHRTAARPEVDGRQAQILGGRPSGCPRQFCGCVASIKLFGRIHADLNLASNWLRKFPRTSPAPLMAAARPGHVMVLLEHVGGDKWKVHDGNSGGGLTRIHIRSIRGFAVVNPHARLAALE